MVLSQSKCDESLTLFKAAIGAAAANSHFVPQSRRSDCLTSARNAPWADGASCVRRTPPVCRTARSLEKEFLPLPAKVPQCQIALAGRLRLLRVVFWIAPIGRHATSRRPFSMGQTVIAVLQASFQGLQRQRGDWAGQVKLSRRRVSTRFTPQMAECVLSL